MTKADLILGLTSITGWLTVLFQYLTNRRESAKFRSEAVREEKEAEPFFKWGSGGSMPAPAVNRLMVYRNFRNEGGAVTDLEIKAYPDIQATIWRKDHIDKHESGKIEFSLAGANRLSTKLYVDGQQMPLSDNGSNYVINTCEWPNGSHILFATAKCASGFGDALNGPTITFGHGVSAFVPVTFSNLVTRISFSQPFFNPTAGQTQQVSAVFAANSVWTLNIVDGSSNVVKAATGSGTSMQYSWDGSDYNNQPVPAGIYYYYVSAQTNGQ